MASLTNLGSAFFGDPEVLARMLQSNNAGDDWRTETTTVTNGYSPPAETSAAPRLSDVRVYTTPHAEPGQVFVINQQPQQPVPGRIEFSYAPRDEREDWATTPSTWRYQRITLSGDLSAETEQWAFGVLNDGEPEPSVPRVDLDTPRAIRVRE
jgi:hypothetical protein